VEDVVAGPVIVFDELHAKSIKRKKKIKGEYGLIDMITDLNKRF
jgi:hypothetical protein